MKNFRSTLVLPLILFAGAALASEHKPMDEKMNMDPEKVDHSAMEMSKDKPAHSAMSDAEFTKLDQNQDGKVVKAEVPSNDPMSAHFDMLDTDKNGELSKVEFAKHHAM